MIRQSFDTGWSAGPAVTAFARIGSSPDHPSVMLPHDVVRNLPRSAERGGGSQTGYFPGGYFEYVKTLDVPEAWREKTVLLEFEAVYRDAVVYVDDDFVAQRPNGYSGFAACLDPFLRFGQTVTIRVECRAHEDSRWYAGSGITRPTCWPTRCTSRSTGSSSRRRTSTPSAWSSPSPLLLRTWAARRGRSG